MLKSSGTIVLSANTPAQDAAHATSFVHLRGETTAAAESAAGGANGLSSSGGFNTTIAPNDDTDEDRVPSITRL
jgi:hypothetical protein